MICIIRPMNNQPPIHIPESLKNAADGESLALFIGAGVSMLGGCPSWNELSDKALQVFKNPAEFELLRGLSPRIKLSIACYLAKEQQQSIPFETLLHSHDAELKNQGANAIYKSLYKLSNFIVTTNYDKWLDKYNKQPDMPEKDRHYKKEKFCNVNFSSAIVHLHGALDDPQSMVLTTGDYIEHYMSSVDEKGNEYNPTLVFLKSLFKLKKVLFIGYSLEEIEILEYVIQKAQKENKKNSQGNEHRHFIIQGFFSYQKSMQDTMSQYYANECGIHLIPFSRDDNDWLQLKNVIDYLAKEIPALPPTTIGAQQEMEALLDD